MATGASNADLALVLIDARKGVLTQTRRHSFILSLIGVKHVVLVVNKIDLVGYDADVFDADRGRVPRLCQGRSASRRCRRSRFRRCKGDNILDASAADALVSTARSWCPISRPSRSRPTARRKPMRFPVQWVNRPNLDFRGFSGTVASGVVKVGDDVLVAASRKPAKITRIVTMDGDLQRGRSPGRR